MRENSYQKESIICFITCLVGLTSFLGVIYLSSITTGNSLASAFPDVPWTQVMNWEKLAEIFNIKTS
ncbi:hypothetical protein [Bacillus sp. Marseille-Q1617]|uniref:hypothetical protein n=1 Tax=Bacillus sp. Marseille-Q1617 TaxID=2736887 RepID=UPI00158AAC67|nr:hypothetical protein [Bacillus sp. Marseille-Q1617]